MPHVKRTDLPAPAGKSPATDSAHSSHLTDTEIDCICDGYVQNAAKVRYLAGIGLTVHTKPNGRPLVARKHFESVMYEPRLHHMSEPKWRLT